MNSFKRFLKGIDVTLLILSITAALFGLLLIASASASYEEGLRYVFIQLIAMALGLAAMYVISLLDYENIAYYWKWIYIFNIVLLAAVLVIGIGEGETGTNRWIRFGSFGFQPAEVVKVCFIITLAKHLDKVGDDINYIKNAGLLFLHALVPIILIIMQPDAGTAVSFAFVFLTMVFIAGIDWRYLAYGFSAFLLASPLIYFFILHDYQRARILEFFNPGSSPLDASYQVLQSKVAIGSGQIAGSGLFNGLQTQLELLPAKHTDFIFAVAGEELGIIGCILLAGLLFCIVWRCIILAKRSSNRLGSLICVGVAALLFFHTIENILMTLGLAPVTGIPLPLISYGGTSMLTALIAISLAANTVGKR
ncbi:MAG: rod shape-determining protein RodA [Clostridiales bacterium]|jgi:rod shape determining protein RodA|nr:rod shape-determining protein RodA [Clostridiales bacterium]